MHNVRCIRGKEAETQNVGSKYCVLPFQRDATVGESQIFVIIPCDGWNLRSWRTVGNLHFRHLSRRFFHAQFGYRMEHGIAGQSQGARRWCWCGTTEPKHVRVQRCKQQLDARLAESSRVGRRCSWQNKPCAVLQPSAKLSCRQERTFSTLAKCWHQDAKFARAIDLVLVNIAQGQPQV